MRDFTNDGSARPPRLLVYANTWGLLEMPHGSTRETRWSFSDCVAKVAEAGFDGFQTGPDNAAEVRAAGLRLACSGRTSTVEDVAKVAAPAADAGADCLTVHLGWGMEGDDEIDALVDAVLAASDRYNLPIYPETHRATVFQDCWRIQRAIERRPDLRFNADFSHLYCGQEFGYRGFETAREYLRPVIERARFIHGRVSDGQCMQVNLADPAKRPHIENFAWMWREVLSGFQAQAGPGDFLAFTPELGPPGSGYSITIPNAEGGRTELANRWTDTLFLKDLARNGFVIAP
jgi:hypothetical protein